MKIFRLDALSEAADGKGCSIGPDELKSASVYLLYCKLAPNAAPKELRGDDGEKVVYVVKGSLDARKGGSRFRVSSGEAFHLKENETILLENTGDKEAALIAAGSRCKRADDNIT